MNNRNGFTLIETMVVVFILAVTMVGMIQLMAYSSISSELAGNKTSAVSEAQNKIEEIRNHSYNTIATDYASGGTPGNTFNLSFLTGKGFVYVDSSNAELLTVQVSICWRNRLNRVIGEDKNLNGTLDAGEDENTNGKIDSPVTMMTMVTRR